MTDTGGGYAVLVGLDWADQKHDLQCLFVQDGKEQHVVLPSAPEDLHEWVSALRARFPNGRIAVCLEQSRGPVVYELACYDFVDMYPVNPVSLKRYRETFHPSGAKDDPSDAAFLLDLLRKHRESLPRLAPEDGKSRELRLLCEYRRKAVDARTALTNALRSALKQYYPQALTLAGEDLHAELACALLMKWPRFDDIAAAKPQTVRKFYYALGSRSETAITERLQLLATSRPLTTDRAVVEPCVLRVHQLVAEIRALNKAIKNFDKSIGCIFQEHSDAFIFKSLPGAGPQLAPRLLAAFGSDRSKYHDALEVNTYSGVAPVIERSGKQKWVHWRWHCPKFLRQSFVEYAGKSIGQCEWARLYYQELMQGSKDRPAKGHQAALRALAFKWNRIIFRCWQERTPYDERKYLASLAKHGSWLAARLNLLAEKTQKTA